MKTKLLYIFAAMAVSAFAAASCENNTTPDDDGGVVADVFFSSVENGDYCYYVGEGKQGEAILSVFRQGATDAAKYEIKVLSAAQGVEVPKYVEFAAGDAVSTLVVKAPTTASTGDVLSFELMFTGKNVNSSANSDAGTVRCEGTFYYYQELVGLAEFGPYDSSSDNGIFDYLGNMKQVVWKLDDQNWLFKNFLGSEYDLKVILNANGLVQTYSYGYDLYAQLDSDGGTTYYFYNEGVEDFADNEYYECFYPKGDKRYIYGLRIYADPANYYSYHMEASDSYPEYFGICCPVICFYGEDEGIDKTFQDWSMLFITFFSPEEMAKKDFESFPEVATVEYPESIYSEDMKDGLYPVQFYFANEGIYADTQYASLEGESFVIDDFMQSGLKVKITPSGFVFTVTTTDAEGNVVSSSTPDSSGYLDLSGENYLYPWENGEADGWCIYGLYMYGGAGYSNWDAEKKEAYFYGSYNIWNPYGGTEGEYIKGAGSVSIYW